ncbi:MAG: S49 family peptidase [Pseudoalteromonas sp.]|uniref:S49 family peptidase n=1 Tax=Pseudoalteromonas sp. TaxID=53249 RepID=UPI001D821325|nr:S49 family peptidase [Pseudoalteromonas sp.]NRA78327.1 S49 family peptidase [Pseudoalteromonas sp.]
MNHNSFLNMLSRACNKAQFIEPNYASTFFSYLGLRAGASKLVNADGTELNADEMKEMASSFAPTRNRERSYEVRDGLAVLPVSGTLLHKYGYLQPRSGATGYDGIIARLNEAISDPEVKAVMLDFDSPGGEAAGCFDATQMIRKMRDIKPIYALCYDTMCSAAMALGSACTERWITQSGNAGSVGVVVAHANYEKHLENEGVEITLMHSGAHKIDGNPYESLSVEVKTRIQAKLDKNRAQFSKIVADNIGMSVEAVLATEAKVYQGQEAVDIGFADRLVNGVEAIPLLIDIIKTKSDTGTTMPKSIQAAASQSNTQASTSQGSGETTNEQLEAARLEGAAQERARCQTILTHEEAISRPSMASHLAFKTEMGADDAVELLKASPAMATLESTGSDPQTNQMKDGLTHAMSEIEQPNLQTTGDSDSLSADQKAESELLSAHTKLTGAK